MPLLYELTDTVLCITTEGDVDYETGLQVTGEALTAARAAWRVNGNRPFDIIFDIRKSTEERSANELRSVAEFIAGYGDVLTGRMAVVADDPYHFALGRIFEVFAEHLGQKPRVFGKYDDAEAWFSEQA